MSFKINPTTGMTVTGNAGSVKRASGEFSPAKTAGTARPAVTAQASVAFGMVGVDALLALQGEEDALTGRRRRQVKRSHKMLDALDDLKVSVLSGRIDDEALLRLQGLIAEHREDIEDERLQGVLNEIETRAFVELAKRRLM